MAIFSIGSGAKSSLEVDNHHFYAVGLVPDEFFLERIDVLLVDGGYNCLDRHRVDHLLNGVLLPAEFLFILEF